MSMFKPTTEDCPNCGIPNTADTFFSVNADRRPDLRDDILAGRFQRVKCAACGTDFRLEPNLSYLDAERRQWVMALPINLLPHWDTEEASAAVIFSDGYGTGAPASAREIGDTLTPRVTFGWAGLREKLVIAQNQLDDVAVEELKMIVLREREGNPLEAGVDLRLLNVVGTELHLGWVKSFTNEASAVFAVQRPLYDEIAGNPAWAAIGKTLDAGLFVDMQRLFITPLPVAA